MSRTIAEIIHTKEALEGAGVKLHRGFGYFELPKFDPFLLFDDFSSERSEDYLAGFPLHPHRGIETVTYILKGDVTHKDSLGNTGTISAGDVQWMTAGSGIVHEEMPHGDHGLIGFQLWVNLPKSHKMMPPRYQELKSTDIPTVSADDVVVHVIAGDYNGTRGPVKDIMAKPTYLDVTLTESKELTLSAPSETTAFVYIITGIGIVNGESFEHGSIIRFENNDDSITLCAGIGGARFLFITGTPLREPIAWHGPIVMNTDDEIRTALYDLQNGTFIK